MTEEIDEGPIISKSIIGISNSPDYQSIRIAVYMDSIIFAISKIKSNDYESKDYPKNGKYYKPIDAQKMSEILLKYGDRRINKTKSCWSFLCFHFQL